MEQAIKAMSEQQKTELYFRMVQTLANLADPNCELGDRKKDDIQDEVENVIFLLRKFWGEC